MLYMLDKKKGSSYWFWERKLYSLVALRPSGTNLVTICRWLFRLRNTNIQGDIDTFYYSKIAFFILF
jgi:hypothetical protein